MKLCLCCKTKAADKVATCPKCGEASFGVCAQPRAENQRMIDAAQEDKKLRVQPKKPNRKARRSAKAEK